MPLEDADFATLIFLEPGNRALNGDGDFLCPEAFDWLRASVGGFAKWWSTMAFDQGGHICGVNVWFVKKSDAALFKLAWGGK